MGLGLLWLAVYGAFAAWLHHRRARKVLALMTSSEWYVLMFPNCTWGIYHLTPEDVEEMHLRKVQMYRLKDKPAFRTELDQLDLSIVMSNT